MNLLKRIFRPRIETRAMPVVPDQIGIYSAGGYSDSGIAVTEANALASSAVYACVNVIATTIATLPIHVRRQDDGARQYAHPLSRLLTEPNEYQAGPTFIEQLMLSLLLWGNAYVAIERDEAGRPIALLPLRSDRTRPVRTADGRLIYATLVNGMTVYLSPGEILHVANMTLDGITGLSPIQQARQAVGLSLALERWAASFFGKGCSAGGILTVPSLKTDGMKAFARQFREQYSGIDNAGKVAVLEKEMAYQPTTIDPEKSQALGQRVHQIREVCRVFRVPAHKVNDLERSTNNNIEHQALEFVQDCLLPWIRKLEAEFARKLLLEIEKPELEIRWNIDGLLRADTAARYSAHATGINAGFLKVNEARAKEGLPPVEGGDVLRVPLNMAPAADPKPANPTPNPATRSLVEDTARRLLTKESKALARAAKKHAGKPDELRSWATDFYTAHHALVTKTMAPIFRAANVVGTPEAFATAHCAESIRMIGSGIDSSPGGVEEFFDEGLIAPLKVVDQLFNGGDYES